MKKKKKKIKNVILFPKNLKKNIIVKKKYKEVKYSISKQYEEEFGCRLDGTYDRLSIYMLMLSIRDLLYEGRNKYAIHSKRKAISWFKSKNNKNPMTYRYICNHFHINPDRLWLQIRRMIKVNKEKLSSILKGIESGIFENPKSEIKEFFN